MTDWPVMTLQEAGVALIDCVHKTPAAVEVGFPYIAIPQMKNGRIDFTDARRISHSDFFEWTKKACPKIHDVVLSRRTNPGVTATFGSACDFHLRANLTGDRSLSYRSSGIGPSFRNDSRGPRRGGERLRPAS
jgi:type I restriction enzyme S subunit